LPISNFDYIGSLLSVVSPKSAKSSYWSSDWLDFWTSYFLEMLESTSTRGVGSQEFASRADFDSLCLILSIADLIVMILL
jgi:hypothetical protein